MQLDYSECKEPFQVQQQTGPPSTDEPLAGGKPQGCCVPLSTHRVVNTVVAVQQQEVASSFGISLPSPGKPEAESLLMKSLMSE